jgi:hypothetical protein
VVQPVVEHGEQVTQVEQEQEQEQEQEMEQEIMA